MIDRFIFSTQHVSHIPTTKRILSKVQECKGQNRSQTRETPEQKFHSLEVVEEYACRSLRTLLTHLTHVASLMSRRSDMLFPTGGLLKSEASSRQRFFPVTSQKSEEATIFLRPEDSIRRRFFRVIRIRSKFPEVGEAVTYTRLDGSLKRRFLPLWQPTIK